MTRCMHRVYLDRFGNPDERVPYPDFLQILWESGVLHEERVIAGLDVVTPDGEDFVSRCESSMRLMTAGVPLIYHAALKTERMSGEPDLLKRIERPSAFGSFSYIPVEIKDGHAWVDSKAKKLKPKPHYIAQLCAYADLLEIVQEMRPATGLVIDVDAQWVSLDLAEYWPEYERLRNEAELLAGGTHLTVAGKKAACDQCVWFEVCDADVRRRDDVTLVAGIGESHREKLSQLGVNTVAELTSTDPSLLMTVKGIGPAFAEKWTRQARVQKSCVVEQLASWTPPRTRFEVSYDIEDFFFSGTVYLHGLLVRSSAAPHFGEAEYSVSHFGQYSAICATASEDEESVWRRFLEKIDELDALADYAVYVYSSHERTNLTKLQGRYGSSAALDRFADRFVDLYDVVRKHFVFPTESTGLKSIASFCGFTWRDADPGGAQSIAWWAQYLKDPVANASLRDRVIAYNEDDVRASFAIRDWMTG